MEVLILRMSQNNRISFNEQIIYYTSRKLNQEDAWFLWTILQNNYIL